MGTERIRTTAYHPAANGLVERFHRQLKSSIKAHPDPTRWTEVLPLVLLGIRTAVKEDIKCTTAEMVYGTTLALPADMIDPTNKLAASDSMDFVARLKRHMAQLCPALTRPTRRQTHIHKDLETCTHVWIRIDAVRKPLQPQYHGPFKVIKRHPKFFTVDKHGKKETVSLDRLKAAYLPSDFEATSTTQSEPITTAKPTRQATTQQPTTTPRETERTTRSGRRVHWPSRYVTIVGIG